MSTLDRASFKEYLTDLESCLAAHSIETDKSKLEQLEHYCRLLREFNAHTNLVADDSIDILINRHVLDSLSALEFPAIFSSEAVSDNKPFSLVDLGSGAGFPGICLALWKPEISVVLVDSNSKKTKFLQSVVDQLELSDRVSVIHQRLELLGHEEEHRGAYDLVTSRALGHLILSAEVGLPLLKVGGSGLFYKTANQVKAEKPALVKLKESLGGGRIKIRRPSIQKGNQEHVLVQLPKNSKGSESFPRSWQNIKRQLNKLNENST